MNRADYWNACFPIVASIPEPDVTECSPNVTKTNSFRRGVNNLTNLGNSSRQGDALPRRCRPAQQPSSRVHSHEAMWSVPTGNLSHACMPDGGDQGLRRRDRKSTRLNSSH